MPGLYGRRSIGGKNAYVYPKDLDKNESIIKDPIW